MTGNSFARAVLLSVWVVTLSCSQSSRDSTSTQVEPRPESSKPSTAVPNQETKIYEVTREDITTIPGITSRNISVAGVRLRDRTRDVDKLMGKPIKTETLPKLYRTAYQNYGIYLDVDRYTGKVTAIYINTNYYKKVRGGLSDLLAHGKLDLLQKSFGQNPVRSEPERQTTMWEYPDKGIQFIHLRQEGTASYTLKLVEPKG